MAHSVFYSDGFVVDLEEMRDYYRIWRFTFPDAGSQLTQFILALESDIVPLLREQAGVGRRYLADRRVEESLLRRASGALEALPALKIVLREWFWGDFALVYGVTDNAVVLVSAKHQRQLGYPAR